MESIRAKFERNNSLDVQVSVSDVKYKPQLETRHSLDPKTLENMKNEESDQETDATNEKIPEIKDIYDYIYGNVQSKLEFYEKKRNQKSTETCPKSKSSIEEDFKDDAKQLENGIKTSEDLDSSSEAENSLSSTDLLTEPQTPVDAEFIEDFRFNQDTNIAPPAPETFQENQKTKTCTRNSLVSLSSVESQTSDKSPQEIPGVLDLSSDCEKSCTKCQEADFINDRTHVLTEINANIKLELEKVKRELKQEIAKNNELNFEIANIESALETYYKEANNQKSTLASLYSTMKNYTSEKKSDFQESYTYKRIKTIADYMETLKSKLGHQDRIIKSNFIENPYYTDIIIKHHAVLKQLDGISHENQELKEVLEKKAGEELDTIKELNRQKFQIENKCKEIENYYKNEISSKEASIETTKDEYKKQLEDLRAILKQNEEQTLNKQKVFEARINNYKQELVIVYRKWKEQRKVNNPHI